MLNCFFVGIGGFIGSVLRYIFGFIPINERGIFPVNTLIINIIGSLLIGIIIALFIKHVDWDSKILLMLKVGLCGGFTTFSSFSAESLNLIESGNQVMAILYIVLSVILCLIAVCIGQYIVK